MLPEKLGRKTWKRRNSMASN